MPTFDYTILCNGARKTGQISADKADEAVQRLRSEGALILELRETVSNASAPFRVPKWFAACVVSSAELELSLRQLALIIGGDVPILLGIKTVGQQCSPVLRSAYEQIHNRVREGCALSVALREHAPFVGRVTLGLLQVGESNGTLDQMFAYASELMERARRLRSDLIQAFSYPAFVVVAGMGVAWFMATKVMPKILAFIQGRQGKAGGLPPITQALLEITTFAQNYGLYLLAAPILLSLIFLLARRQRASGEIVDAGLLRIPLLGGAFQAHANAMWCRTLGALLGSGVNIIPALELLENTQGNWFFAAQFRIMQTQVREGRSFIVAFEQTGLPKQCPMARAMISVSEQSGGLDSALGQVADFYEDELQRRVKLLSRLVEPVMYTIVGAMVGFVYFAFFMAMLAAQRSSL